MVDIVKKTIGQLVADDYRTAEVFKNHNIDFCCGGNQTIQEAVAERNIKLDDLLREIDEIQRRVVNNKEDFMSLPLDQLTEHIESKHHRYVEERIPLLRQYLNKIKSVHGANHPELHHINKLFVASAGELAMHMKKEELILFPYIRKMVEAKRENKELTPSHFGSVKNPIQAMMRDHDNEGERFRKIEKLSNGFIPPEDACNTYKVAFAFLKEFQDDLHMHIHLENNILFPRAEVMERE